MHDRIVIQVRRNRDGHVYTSVSKLAHKVTGIWLAEEIRDAEASAAKMSELYSVIVTTSCPPGTRRTN